MRMATHLSSEKPCPILYCSMILTYTHRDAKASSRAFLYASKSSMKLVALMYVQLMQLFYLMLGLKDAWKWQAVQFWVNLLRVLIFQLLFGAKSSFSNQKVCHEKDFR